MTDGIGGLSYVKGLLRASDKVSRARASNSEVLCYSYRSVGSMVFKGFLKPRCIFTLIGIDLT